MQLIKDEQSQKIVSGSISGRIQSDSNPPFYETMEISFSNIPASYWGNESVTFSVLADDFCNASIITDFDEVSTYNGFHRTLISYSCNSYTEFTIRLRIAE